MRIKKKFLLSVFILVCFVFIFFYLNHLVPKDKLSPDPVGYEGKRYNKKTDSAIFKKPRHHFENPRENEINNQIESDFDTNDDDLPSKDIKIDQILPDTDLNKDQSCNIDVDVVPNANVQMLDAYREIPFDNVDGGVWKQGWNIEYDIHQWNRNHKLKVFVVPHSHNDPGWINTFDEYYERQTKHIFSNMLRHLDEHENMRFIWAEIVYFSKWYDSLSSPESKETVKKFVKRKQLEFVTGGWVMPDEACSHWYSILQSLTEGQTWLKKTFNLTNVKSSWAIDPFGHSSVMPLILKESGFENMLIQRTHYSVKKYLAQRQQLEFKWRQVWDTKGTTDMFTHMMPFYSYDQPHTCGPDPKICCQFDFKRLPGYGVSCPWKVPPVPITDDNVAKRAEMIVDQWRKKSVLYKTRSVLIPLGDDFRYTQSVEWETQRSNYEKLFEYINNEPSMNVEAKFGTLQEYFDSVHNEKPLSQFSSLSGDFFTYADRDDHYWSGYFTSRPYYKRMDRILMNYLRSAEMLHAWSSWDKSSDFEKRLENARRALSIFQHHDGVTGTAKDYVMKDYDQMMVEGIKHSKFVIQQAVYRLLTESNIYHPDYSFTYFNIDDSRTATNDDSSRSVIIIGDEIPFKYVVIHNSQTYSRNEIVEFFVARPFVCVTDSDGNSVDAQVSVAWSWHHNLYGSVQPQASTTKYRLLFTANVPPLGLAVYKLVAKNRKDECSSTTFAQITILTDTPFDVNLNEYPEKVKFSEPREVSLRINDNSPGASFNKLGLLKSLSQDGKSPVVPVHLEFMKYGTRSVHGQMSGAYLFLPDGPAQKLSHGNPTVLVTNGQLESSVSSGLPFVIHESILRVGGDALEIRNFVDIGEMANTEIVMRLSTNIKNGNAFFTDLNGMYFLKREIFNKIPLQGNYYPIPGGMFIEDDKLRLTLFTATPLGGSSLKEGELEIMQDRRLNQDDERGLGQGVTDNRAVLNIFKLVLENRDSCRKMDEKYPAGYLSSTAYLEQKKLLHPFEKLIYSENEWNGVKGSFGNDHEEHDVGFEIAAMRTLPHIRTNSKSSKAVGLVVHRTNLDKCSVDGSVNGNQLSLKRLLGLDENEERVIYRSALTMLETKDKIQDDSIALCPMDIKAFILK